MNSVDTFVGRRIRQFRWVCGVTQAELAAHLSVLPSQISAYEAGTDRVPAAQLLQIATLLDLPVAAFFEGMAASSGAGRSTQPKVPSPAPSDLPSTSLGMTDPRKVALQNMAQTIAAHSGQTATPALARTNLRPASAAER
ncbi:helix-turn-helix domain-containing protein [Pseudotabrizicola formosa]|uniref:helix-turn-helix domain-containing protein n=1 Tax=Pseudotabrizicola formosa TaxID=2030009 RepID=UPI000CD0CE2C|nr:helix-turn-helix transcriptional regulator [Pseudotabrizicola formosa]